MHCTWFSQGSLPSVQECKYEDAKKFMFLNREISLALFKNKSAPALRQPGSNFEIREKSRSLYRKQSALFLVRRI
jgi:hypothetical protein